MLFGMIFRCSIYNYGSSKTSSHEQGGECDCYMFSSRLPHTWYQFAISKLFKWIYILQFLQFHWGNDECMHYIYSLFVWYIKNTASKLKFRSLLTLSRTIHISYHNIIVYNSYLCELQSTSYKANDSIKNILQQPSQHVTLETKTSETVYAWEGWTNNELL